MSELATFAAGCFWGVEDVFMSLHGVIKTRVGYCGGHTENPTYSEVCSHNTGHAEAVEITYDPLLIDYDSLLSIFWECHDPTQVNRQGPDFGSQYRSVIFFHSDIQHACAISSRDNLENRHLYRYSIATKIEPASFFWEAEEYHQKYHLKNSGGCGF